MNNLLHQLLCNGDTVNKLNGWNIARKQGANILVLSEEIEEAGKKQIQKSLQLAINADNIIASHFVLAEQLQSHSIVKPGSQINLRKLMSRIITSNLEGHCEKMQQTITERKCKSTIFH